MIKYNTDMAGVNEYEQAIKSIKRKNFLKSERYLQYAANARHSSAISCLKEGIEEGLFTCTAFRLRAASIELLDKFVTDSPTELEIETLLSLLLNFFIQEHRLVLV